MSSFPTSEVQGSKANNVIGNESIQEFEASAATSVQTLTTAFTSLVDALQRQESHISRLEEENKAKTHIKQKNNDLEIDNEQLTALSAMVAQNKTALEALQGNKQQQITQDLNYTLIETKIQESVNKAIDVKLETIIPRVERLEAALATQTTRFAEVSGPLEVLEIRLAVLENALIQEEDEKDRIYARIERIIQQRREHLNDSKNKTQTNTTSPAPVPVQNSLHGDKRELLDWFIRAGDKTRLDSSSNPDKSSSSSSSSFSSSFPAPTWAFGEHQKRFYKWLQGGAVGGAGASTSQTSQTSVPEERLGLNVAKKAFASATVIQGLEGALQACVKRLEGNENILAEFMGNTLKTLTKQDIGVTAAMNRARSAEENLAQQLEQVKSASQQKWVQEQERHNTNAQILENLDEKVSQKADIQMVLDRVSRAEYQNAVLDLAKANELVLAKTTSKQLAQLNKLRASFEDDVKARQESIASLANQLQLMMSDLERKASKEDLVGMASVLDQV